MWIKFFVVALVIMLVIVVAAVVNHHVKNRCVLISWIQFFVLLQTNKEPTWRHLQQTERKDHEEVDDENYCYYYLKVKLLENPKQLVVIIIHHLGSSIVRLLPLFLQQLYNLSIPNQQYILFDPSCSNANKRMALILNNSGKQKDSL